jgi:hypothetical protein
MSDATAQRPTSDSVPADWPEGLAPFWIGEAEVLDTAASEDERPGRDSLGNAGSVRSRSEAGKVTVHWPRGRVVRRLEQSGLATLRDTRGECELHRAVTDLPAADVDPFLLENSVRVLVRGRDFPGQQRAVLEAKAEALRRELDDPSTTQERREKVEGMLRAMEDGLRATVEMRAVTRRFRPVVHVDRPCDTLGEVVPLGPGWRLLYRVRSRDPESGELIPLEDADDGLMVFHVVALGDRQAVLLYTGGVHGMRHLTDLESSDLHDAWFVNRERSRTEATAPWISRAVYRELAENGTSRVVVHRRRDAEPVSLTKVGEETLTLRVDDADVEVPVLRCESGKDDELLILADPKSPLVLYLRESGAELVRTIEAVLPPLQADA